MAAPQDVEAERVHREIEARLFGHAPRPVKVGRYTIIDRVGAGAMGVVYAAYDAELDRRVAVKILHPEEVDEDERRELQARLVREARAMAKLAHPNVVTVHEVGLHASSPFLAMEFVEGPTLRTWAAEPRTTEEILALFVDLGRGLAAAHAAGLVHRDFKPDNVLIGADGRPRITDFGLALGKVMGTLSASAESSLPPDSQVVTATGAVVGTPAYMSPEQFRGEDVDARSDQFAFCVSLFEVLYGKRPFAAATVADLALVVEDGTVQDVEPRAGVTAEIDRAIRRGLQPRWVDRFPRMDDLVSVLGAAPRRSGGWWAAAALATIGVGTASWVAFERGTVDRCSGGAAELAEVWNDAARTQLQSHLRRTAGALGEPAGRTFADAFDAFAAGWAAAHRDACEATERGEQSSAMLDAKMSCLAARKRSFAALLGGLADAEAGVARDVVTVLGALPDPSTCSGPAVLAWTEPPTTEAQRAAVEQAREAWADLTVAYRLQPYTEVAEQARALLERAEEIGYDPLTADVARTAGDAAGSAGDRETADRLLRRALFLAQRSKNLDAVVRAASSLTHLWGVGGEHMDFAETFAQLARATLHARGEDEELTGTVENAWATALYGAGRYADAAEGYAAALEAFTDAFGPSDARLLPVLNNLALCLTQHGDHVGAWKHLSRARDIGEATLGPEHPEVASILHSQGEVALRRGEPDAAAEVLTTALRIRERTLGPRHPLLVKTLNNLAGVAAATGDDKAGMALIQRALDIHLELGGEDAGTAAMRSNVAYFLARLGQLDASVEEERRALAIRERVLGPDHPDVATSLLNLGTTLVQADQAAEAKQVLTRALQLREAAFGPDSPRLDNVRDALADAQARLDQEP